MRNRMIHDYVRDAEELSQALSRAHNTVPLLIAAAQVMAAILLRDDLVYDSDNKQEPQAARHTRSGCARPGQRSYTSARPRMPLLKVTSRPRPAPWAFSAGRQSAKSTATASKAAMAARTANGDSSAVVACEAKARSAAATAARLRS